MLFFLNCSIEESVEQLQYHLARLETQRKVLEFTREYLEQEATRIELFGYWNGPPVIFSQLEFASYLLENEVMNSERQRYQCLVSKNPIDCKLYSFEYEIVTELMDVFADLYLESQFIRTATTHRQFSIPSITDSINALSREIEQLEFRVHLAIVDSTKREIEDEKHDSKNVLTNFHFSSETASEGKYNFHLPSSIQNRLLWYIDPESTRLSPKETIDDYNLTINHLNSYETNVTAKFIKGDIHRRWFKPDVFGETRLSLVGHWILKLLFRGSTIDDNILQHATSTNNASRVIGPNSLLIILNYIFLLGSHTSHHVHILPTAEK